jgi:hypothetical protein
MVLNKRLKHFKSKRLERLPDNLNAGRQTGMQIKQTDRKTERQPEKVILNLKHEHEKEKSFCSHSSLHLAPRV